LSRHGDAHMACTEVVDTGADRPAGGARPRRHGQTDGHGKISRVTTGAARSGHVIVKADAVGWSGGVGYVVTFHVPPSWALGLAPAMSACGCSGHLAGHQICSRVCARTPWTWWTLGFLEGMSAGRRSVGAPDPIVTGRLAPCQRRMAAHGHTHTPRECPCRLAALVVTDVPFPQCTSQSEPGIHARRERRQLSQAGPTIEFLFYVYIYF
jgi:hypothetical protein